MAEGTIRFLGRGWGFPVAFAQGGAVAMAEEVEDVRQSIRIILGTNRGERVMRPDFGSNLNRLVFEPMSTTTMSLAQHYVEEALTRWEPRIDQVEVSVDGDPPMGRLLIEVSYRIRSTNTFYNLVYPFYLLEAEGEASL